MARSPSAHPFDDLIAHAAEMLASGIASAIARGGGAGAAVFGAPKARKGPKPGRKLQMDCRYPGCKNRSKGPRFHFLCDEHLKLPKKAQQAALATNAAK